MIQACLFDIGNVLVTFDYSRTFSQFAGRTPRSFEEIRGHLAEASEALETGRLSSNSFIESSLAFLGDAVTRSEFLEAFTDIFQPVTAMWQIVETVREMVPVYLFSNTSEIHEASLFRQFPVFSRFHGGFFSWRLGSMKPHAAMYERAVAELALPAEAIAYIDDLPANIETGRRIGFRSHLYNVREHQRLNAFLAKYGLPLPAGS